MLLLNWIPRPLHRRLYRVAHAIRVRIWRVWRPDVHGVRVIALDRHGRVLLVRHSYGSDRWLPPGGGMRRGEDPLQAAARELREETGCRLTRPRVLQTSEEALHGTRNFVRIVAGRTEDDPRPDRREIIDTGFFALDDLPASMAPELAQRIRKWAGRL